MAKSVLQIFYISKSPEPCYIYNIIIVFKNSVLFKVEIMNSSICSATTIGVDAHLVQVEADLSFGIPQFYIVGLPDTAIKESNKRILTALKNSGFKLPAKRITVNLAPADLKKEGTVFDLPIALAILQAGGFLSMTAEMMQETLFLGELSLDGSIRFIKGALAIACDAKRLGKRRIILPKANAAEAALIKDMEIIGVDHLTELIAYLRGECAILPTHTSFGDYATANAKELFDFADVKGQYQAKRALQIAAAGRHNILFIGSPGSGKTMLAQRLPSIMPAMSFDEVLQTSKIYSISGKLGKQALIVDRPFRAPHHTISQAGLVGGGTFPQPGEISLAHHGILFLDELTEFRRTTLEVLRQPLESKHVCIARAQQSISFPASFLLIAALNPCPCGYWGDKKRACHCSSLQVTKYLEKLSGPLLDRIDLQVQVQSVAYDTIKTPTKSVSSQEMFAGVQKAVIAQHERFGHGNVWNAYMTSDLVEKYCVLSADAEHVMKQAFEALHLSMRGYHKILKVARTIADLESSPVIQVAHIQEAIMYRSLDQFLETHRK